jgi:hypothetical protein
MKSVYSLPLFILLVWTGLAVLAPILPLYPDQIFLDKILLLPCWEQWLGYDDLGRSISARLIMGARTSLTVAIIVVSISFLLGTFLGVFLGQVFDYGCRSLYCFPGSITCDSVGRITRAGINECGYCIVYCKLGWVCAFGKSANFSDTE